MQNWKFPSHSSRENGSYSLRDFEDDERRKFQDMESVQSGTRQIDTRLNNRGKDSVQVSNKYLGDIFKVS
jgi:hypothetical protein